LFGVTFLAAPPDHPDLPALTQPDREAEVRAFVERSREGSRFRARASGDERDGAFTGSFASHPATGEPVPVWVADYVVGGYGTGAVMGVPAHDRRDFEFARTMGLPVRPVVVSEEISSAEEHAPAGSAPFTGQGVVVDSGPFTGMSSAEAGHAIAEWLAAHGRGRPRVQYRLRDWLISRQRYWGPPIPVVYCERCGEQPVPDEDLPVLLPHVEAYRPTGTGKSPLAAVKEFVETTCPRCRGPARRETDVSDTFLDSAWYFLRYPSSDVADRPWDAERTARMLPVDLYAGGREHVVRHHLYARFVIRALHDLGLVPFAEPFPKIRLHGLLVKDGAKMSKSRGNVVNPDAYVERAGADVLRMYLLFCGDWQEGGDFRDDGIAGIERFARRIHRLLVEPEAHEPGPGLGDLKPLHRAAAAVTGDLEHLKFNTAIARLMELVAWAQQERHRLNGAEWDRVARTTALLVAPFAPHLAEEAWARIAGADAYSVHTQPWPEPDPAALAEDEITLVIQVDGRVRDRVQAPAGIDRDEALALALGRPGVRRSLDGAEPRRVVFVPDRLINLVST